MDGIPEQTKYNCTEQWHRPPFDKGDNFKGGPTKVIKLGNYRFKFQTKGEDWGANHSAFRGQKGKVKWEKVVEARKIFKLMLNKRRKQYPLKPTTCAMCKCIRCNVNLCLQCYNLFHTLSDDEILNKGVTTPTSTPRSVVEEQDDGDVDENQEYQM